jgi:general secretion pathway protein A
MQPPPQPPAEFAPAPVVAQPAASARPVAATVEAAAADDSYLLPPAEGLARLWRLASDDAPPATPCDGAVHAGVACIETQAATWDELAGVDRPLLLDMVTTERFAAAVLLLGVEGRNAWVVAGDALRQVDLATLGPLWSGGYRFFWRPPRAYERPLSRGDSHPAVAEIAALFARLDGQQSPLASSRFNEQLDRRVRLFQRAMGLDADGVVGVQTLLALNSAAGVDTSAAEARQQLAALAPPATDAGVN